MGEERKLIDVRFEIASYRGLIDPSLFQDILEQRVRLEDVIGSNDLLVRVNRKEERALEASAVRHLTELEPDIQRTSGKLKRSYMAASMEAWRTAKEAVRTSNGYIDQRMILDVNRALTGSFGFRSGTVHVTGSEVSRTSPLSIGKEFDYVFGAVNDKATPVSTIERGILYHFHVCRIHPFTDGNGRTARIVQNATLVNSGLPPATVTPEERVVYIDAIEKALIAFRDRREDLEDHTLTKAAGTKDKHVLRTEYGQDIYLGATDRERAFYNFLASKVNIDLRNALDNVKRHRR